MNKRDRSMANSRSEAKRIFNQRQAIRRLERENQKLKNSINKAVEISLLIKTKMSISMLV